MSLSLDSLWLSVLMGPMGIVLSHAHRFLLGQFVLRFPAALIKCPTSLRRGGFISARRFRIQSEVKMAGKPEPAGTLHPVGKLSVLFPPQLT